MEPLLEGRMKCRNRLLHRSPRRRSNNHRSRPQLDFGPCDVETC